MTPSSLEEVEKIIYPDNFSGLNLRDMGLSQNKDADVSERSSYVLSPRRHGGKGHGLFGSVNHR